MNYIYKNVFLFVAQIFIRQKHELKFLEVLRGNLLIVYFFDNLRKQTKAKERKFNDYQ